MVVLRRRCWIWDTAPLALLELWILGWRMRGFSLVDFLNRPSRVDGLGTCRSIPWRMQQEFNSKFRWPGDSLSNGDDSKVNGVERIPSLESSNGVEYPEHFIYVPHPQEPIDLDRPVRCPPPEPCIVHDGRIFRDRLANSRRRSDLLGSMRETDHLEYYSTPPSRRRYRGSRESIQAPALIAPDLVATKIVD